MSDTPSPKTSGMPIWVALMLLLVIALVGLGAIGGLYYYMHGRTARVQAKLDAVEAQKKQTELDRQKAEEQARLTLAGNRQQEVLAQVRAATNALEKLLADVQQLRADAEAIKSNEDGKRVALHPDLVRQARAFYDLQMRLLPPDADIIPRLEGARRIEQQLLQAAGTAFTPEADLTTNAQSGTLWANLPQDQVRQVRAALTSLIQESKIKFTTAKLTADSPTLDAALQQLATKEAATTAQTVANQAAAARQEADLTVAKATATQIIEDAKRQAAEKLAAAEAAAAQTQRDSAVARAQQGKADAQAKVAVQTAEEKARKIELRKKASEPEIQVKLAPFITPGYWQLDRTELEQKPLSFTKLKGSGALAPTTKGGSVLALIVSTSTDKVRPRWDINPKLYTRHPDQIERIKDAQQLLNELGSVLVEMGQLQP